MATPIASRRRDAGIDGALIRPGWPRFLWAVGAFLLVVMLFHIGALAITRGPINGPVSLRKPATFAETGWLVAWAVALILPTLRARPWQRAIIGGTTAIFAVGETAIMAIEAWRGVPSHYNFSTPFDAALMRGGAAGTAGLFLIGVIVMLIAALRARGVPASPRLGIVAGIVVLLLGCAIGFGMISNNSGVYQGSFGSGFARRVDAYVGPSAETVGPQYLLIRPATAGGDLLLPHAIAIHGLILLAVPALLLARTSLSPARQLLLVCTAVGGVGIALAILLIQALSQRPLDQLHPLALATLGICGLGLVGVLSVVAAFCPRTRVTTSSGTAS